MANAPLVQYPNPASVADRLFRGLVQCQRCSARRLQEIRWGDVVLLRRDGTVSLGCPHCSLATPHRLVRIGP